MPEVRSVGPSFSRCSESGLWDRIRSAGLARRKWGKANRWLALGVFFLIAGCGTLRIHIDYGNTAVPLRSATTGATGTRTAPTATPAPASTDTASPSLSLSPAPDDRSIAVAAGNDFTCALSASGNVRCWGNNEHGQLGNGGTAGSIVPVGVTGLPDAKAITAGWGHACALTAAGGVKCWGYNRNGELGDGSNSDSNRPMDVAGLTSGITAIDAGEDHTCAVIAAGGVKCWGFNDAGQLGDGTKASRSVPVDAAGFTGGVVSIAAGWSHTCALTASGGAKCWGSNEYGQLGDGEKVDFRLTPVDVTGLTYGVLQITAKGGQNCALTAGGGVSCWGNNKYGQLGDGTAQQRNSPVQTIGLINGIRDVVTGWNHTCAVLSTGELECWGWNYYGQLGDGTKVTRTAPAGVLHLTDGVRDLALGFAHTCVVTELGAVKCWGSNTSGQLGDGTRVDSGIPRTVVGLGSLLERTNTMTPTVTAPESTTTPTPTVVVPENTNTMTPTVIATERISPTPRAAGNGALAVAADEYNTCALTSHGEVKCWGDNSSGQLGYGKTAGSAFPVAVNWLGGNIVAITLGGMNVCALTADGKLRCWGRNLAQSADASIFTGIARSMAMGMEHTCVLTDAGGVQCWGEGSYGQLGAGTMANAYTPVDVAGLTSGVGSISSGPYSVCAVTLSGGVKCWGYNVDGELGDGTTTLRYLPVDVRGLSSGVARVSVGRTHTCALMTSGGVKCWGNNLNGQLGNGTTVDSSIPVDVLEPENDFIDVRAGNNVTCALTRSGGVKCWGESTYVIQSPELNDCSPASSCSKPVDITGLSQGAAALAMGWYHACIITEAGAVICWGNNGAGQLGDGTKEDRPAPGVVIDL